MLRSFWCIGFSIALLAPFCHNLEAAPGDLDLTFDGDGIVFTDLPGHSGVISGLALQADGKIVAAGSIFTDNYDFAIARYNPDGRLDTDFGFGGYVMLDFSTNNYNSTGDVAIQPDGKIVVVGEAQSGVTTDIAVVRYEPDGDLDPAFSSDGKVLVDFFGNSDYGYAVAIQPDGKILVAGSTLVNLGDLDFAVVRFNADGSLDSSFSTDGKATVDFNDSFDEARAIAIQPDGAIVVAGEAEYSGRQFAVARFTPTGVLDSSFSSDGKATAGTTNVIDVIRDMVILPDQKILVAGHTDYNGGGNTDIALARFNPDGSPDISFDIDGFYNSNLFFFDGANAVVLQPDGKFVIAGNMWIIFGTRDFMIARFNSDGTLDTTFNNIGFNGIDFLGSVDDANDLLIQSNGRFVLAGRSTDGLGNSYFALARFQGDCLFCDDFEDGALHDDWTYASPSWNETGGNLVATPSTKKAEVIADPVFAGCDICSVETTLSTAGGQGNKIWFLAWHENRQNSLEILMKEESDKWIIKQRVGGSIVAKTKALSPIQPGKFYILRITFDGSTFTLFVDGTALTSMQAVGSPHGTVGYRVKSTTGQFSDLHVY